jgi:hypothetical protein
VTETCLPNRGKSIGGVVSHQPRGATENACADGPSGRRATSDCSRDCRDRMRKRGDGKTVAQALPGRGYRRFARRAASGLPAQGDGGVLRAVGVGCPPSSPQPGIAVLGVDTQAPGRLHGRTNRHPGGVRDHPGAPEGGGHRAEPPPAHHHQPRPRIRSQKRRSKKPAMVSHQKITSTTPTSST